LSFISACSNKGKSETETHTQVVLKADVFDSTRNNVSKALAKIIEFNPYWTVPRSIAVKEMLPSLKRSPNYLQSHNMDLFNGNTEVAIPGSFTNYTADNFPFTIRENPGPKNSLGQVKLMFPNPYSIYLHDTPGKYLFERDERSLVMDISV
jgi:murein L,D-transpeptidase YcbB/YkuD